MFRLNRWIRRHPRRVKTQGCVRPGAIDAIQYGYRLIVPHECVGDRHDIDMQDAFEPASYGTREV